MKEAAYAGRAGAGSVQAADWGEREFSLSTLSFNHVSILSVQKINFIKNVDIVCPAFF